MIRQSSVTIPATDGFQLAGMVVEPTSPARGAVQIHPGTGFKKEFYLKFAAFLAEHGFATVVFDYRGIGGSRPATLRGFDAKMHHWGERDMAGVLEWLIERHPTIPKFVVGHSVGGQLVGLMRNHSALSGVVTIAASTGYWRNFPAPIKFVVAGLWYVYFPLTSAVLGYIPSGPVGLGEDLPKGVGMEWATWCTDRDYLAPYLGKSIPVDYYEAVSLPWKSFYFSDDFIANDRSVPELHEFYRNCRIETERIAPSEVKAAGIGHHGFFSSRFRESLWPRPAAWLDRQATIV